MSHQTLRAAAQSLRNIPSAAVRTAADIPSTLPMLNISAGLRPRLDHAARPPQPQSSGRILNPTPPTSLPKPLVFEGPSGQRPVVRNHHDSMPHRTASSAGAEPVVTIFEGPTYSGGH
ncbi:hypothetical protein B0H19DRAFT_1183962 [Mycena capillaripes]|nr:hypothetical protein B0H19DRAFT_1183962 [Mycena capillaripes]